MSGQFNERAELGTLELLAVDICCRGLVRGRLTSYNLLSGLYCFTKFSVPTGVISSNFMDRKEPRFRDLTATIQVRYRELRTEGVGAIVKHAAIVTPEEESLCGSLKVWVYTLH